jgi:hypothetical protein
MENLMKRLLPLAASAIILGITAPAQAQYHGGGATSGSKVPEGYTPMPKNPPADPEGTAEDLALHGKCDEAVPILRRLATRTDFAISWYHLGQCLLTLADAEGDKTRAADLRKEGACWVLRAAGAGFGEAEAKAVTLSLDGVGVASDPVEAEKWALIYHRNGLRIAIGLPDIAQNVSNRLDAALNDTTRAQAEARADAWTPASHPEE